MFVVRFLILCASVGCALGSTWRLNPKGFVYHGDAKKFNKGAILNTVDHDSLGAIATVPVVGETLELKTSNFTITSKVVFSQEDEDCPGSATLFSLGGGVNCLLKPENFAVCDGVNFILVQDDDFYKGPGAYLIKNGKLIDESHDIEAPRGTVEFGFEVTVHEDGSHYIQYSVGGEDIFHAKDAKGYDVAYSANDVGSKLVVAGFTDEECAQIHRIKDIIIDVEGLELDADEKHSVKKYLKSYNEDNLTTVLIEVGQSLLSGEDSMWVPFSVGMMIAAVAAVVLRRRSKKRMHLTYSAI